MGQNGAPGLGARMYNGECGTLGVRLIFLYIFRDVQQSKAKKFNDSNTVKIYILNVS
jgi:hypothetical protein